jgi:predicted Rossmann fold flavoprotein
MKRFDIVVVGGGAAGLTAAISASRKGRRVLILERMPSLGRKILACGGGRCNLSNEKIDEPYYNVSARPLVRHVFSRFGAADIKSFFNGLGLALYSENNKLFPMTNQSSSVLKVLEMELERLSVAVLLNSPVAAIERSSRRFAVSVAGGERIACGSVIAACGGKTYPALGSDGSFYRIAARFGHTVIEPVPSAVPLVVKDPICHALQGQRVFATASYRNGEQITESSGDILFTKYGLSGTAILDISEEVSIAVNREKRKDVCISIDMVPFLSREDLKKNLEERVISGVPYEDLLCGILPNRFSATLKNLLKTGDFDKIADILKARRFAVSGTRGWNEAEFTAGGISCDEVKPGTLESKIVEGLYIAGEALDVQGCRGGYNLAWAWASGFISGMTG